jgi:transcriptional regulator with XRE-family HTH domain
MAKRGPDDGLGERLARYRQQKELNQAELARRAEISPAYLSELEGGAGRRPSGRVLLGLADALGVTVADLLGQTIKPADPQQLPAGLADFATQANLPASDIKMLSSIKWRGDPPKTAKRWEVIYDAIRSSQVFDED